MSAASHFRLMALNNAWANATLYAAIAQLPDGAFTAEAPGFFGSVHATMNHIWQVDLFYLDALEGGGVGRAVYDRSEIDTIEDLAIAQSENDMRFATFCSALTGETLAEPRLTERSDGIFEERVDALILHLVQHQIHHRGQAHVQIGHHGIAPPQLDDFYLEYGRVPSAQAYFI